MACLLTSPPGLLRGALKPRVELRPASVGTHGDIAAELMAAAGKPLEPWQRDGVDLMLSVMPDGRWACYEYCEWVARQNGKGAIGEARALVGFFVLDEDLIMWSAHEVKTAMEGFRKLRRLIRALGEPIDPNTIDFGDYRVKISNVNGDQGFERLDTGQRIKFISRSKGSGRGFTAPVNIIDETYAYTGEQHDALMPTMMAIPNSQIVYLSSPPLSGESGEVMFALRERAENKEERLGYRDWGLAIDLDAYTQADLDKREHWESTNPGLGYGRVTEESIQKLRKSMTVNKGRGFAREVMGMWPRQALGGGAIDMAQWNSLASADSRRSGWFALGVDIAPDREYAAIVLYGESDSGFHAQLTDYRAGTDWIIPRLLELNKIKPMAAAMGRGTMASLRTELAEAGFRVSKPLDEQPEWGDIVPLSYIENTAAVGQLMDAVHQGSFRHNGQGELDTAAQGAVTKQREDSLSWSRKEAAADITPLVALTNARWAYTTRKASLAGSEYNLLESIW